MVLWWLTAIVLLRTTWHILFSSTVLNSSTCLLSTCRVFIAHYGIWVILSPVHCVSITHYGIPKTPRLGWRHYAASVDGKKWICRTVMIPGRTSKILTSILALYSLNNTCYLDYLIGKKIFGPNFAFEGCQSKSFLQKDFDRKTVNRPIMFHIIINFCSHCQHFLVLSTSYVSLVMSLIMLFILILFYLIHYCLLTSRRLWFKDFLVKNSPFKMASAYRIIFRIWI